MSICCLSPVRVVEGDHGLLAKRRFAPPTPQKRKRMTMATCLSASVESCEGGHGLCQHLLEGRRFGPSSPKKEGGDDHRQLLPFPSRELWV